jgi:hypothetical protein
MEKVKRISQEYEPKIRRLEKQLEELRDKELDAFDRVLTEDQRQQFRDMRERFLKKGKGRKKGKDD